MPRTIETTVTFLEMTHPPRRPVHHSPPEPVAIMRAENPPPHFYRYMFETIGRPYHWVSRLQMDDGELGDLLADDKTHLHVLYVSGWPAGFCESFEIEDGVVEIKYFGLVGERIGQGLGSYFFAQMLYLLWSEDVRKILLETCTMDHPHALPLYQKYGFSPYGQTERTMTVE